MRPSPPAPTPGRVPRHGTVFADALSAGAAAAAQGGAVLLCAAGSIPTVVRTGWPASPPPRSSSSEHGRAWLAVGSDARDYAPVVARVAGIDRYATSAALVRRAFSETPVSSLWVATGRDYPDALVTGAAAGADRAPCSSSTAGHRACGPRRRPW